MESRAFQPDYQVASSLRMKFFSEWILKKHPMYFKTQEERDWAYIAKREYNYEVLIKSACYGFGFANVFWSASIFLKKRFTILPLVVIWPVATLACRQYFYFKVNKRLFDMCNLGDEFELGRARNKVLAECNHIQDVEDF